MKSHKTIALALALSTAFAGFGQDWNRLPGGDVISGSEYLGAAAGSLVPLRLKTVANQPIELTTYDVLRARLNGAIAYTIGGFTGQNKDGNLLLSPDVNTFYAAGAPGPYSLLHLAAADNTAQQGSYRDWMKTGITFTGNADQSYVGQKAGETDFTDMVLHWSDNPSKYLKDRMRMIFTSNYNPSATSGATSLEGLEGMRLFPVDNDHVNVGLGDFYAGNLLDPPNVIEPTERLDILNGKLRIRQLPTDAIASTLTKFLVVDDTPGPDYGVVKWRNVPGGTGTNCDWESLSGNNLTTAWRTVGTTGACPDASWKLGIGKFNPSYKLDIFHTEGDGGVGGGLRIDLKTNSAGWRYGIFSTVQPMLGGANLAYAASVSGITMNAGLASPGIADAYGLFGRSSIDQNLFVRNSMGVHGDAMAYSGNTTKLYGGHFQGWNQGGSVTSAYGVYGEAKNGGTNYGVWATASGPVGSTNWAIWSYGAQFSTTAGTWTTSDESLKMDIEEMTGGLEKIMQLNPKTYQFRTEEFPNLHLSTGLQNGLIAQEMQDVVPELVRSVQIPAEEDSLGNEVSPAMKILAVKYEGLIPILISAVQQQQSTIAQMQDQINNCCAAQGGMTPHGAMEQKMALQENDLQEQRLLIIPNPVADLTTLEYYVPKAGQVSLQVSTSDGKPLATLREELAEAGAYNYRWNTTKLSAGTYFCTFMLDGAVVVKRAVKVKR